MSRSIKKILAVCFTFCMFFSTFTFKSSAKTTGLNASDAEYLKKNNFETIAENTLMTLYANEASGEFAVEDKRNDYVWYSNPKDRSTDKIAQGINKMDLNSQIGVSYTDCSDDGMKIKNNYTGSVLKKQTSFEKIDNGFEITYNFPDEDGFSVPIKITLGDNYLGAEIDIAKLKETKHKVFSVDLLPYFGAGGIKDKGYIFVPDGSGALINFNSNKQNMETYNEAIYGRDTTFSSNQNPVKRESIKLPVFGIKNGENAFLAVVDKGDSEGNITANSSGIKSSYNNAFTTFDIRKFDSFTVGESSGNIVSTKIYEKGKSKIGSCRVKYYLLQGEQSDYNGMAKTYRDYLVNEKGVKPNNDIKPQMYLDLYGAVKKQKSIFGIPFNVTQPLTTYQDAENILKQLRKDKVDNIVVNYHDWYAKSIGSRIPTRASTIGKLGGAGDFKDLINYSKNSNVKLFPQVDFLKVLNGGFNFFSSFSEAKTLGSIPATIFDYKLSTYFKDNDQPVYSLLAPNKLMDVMEKFNSSYEKYNVGGIGLDTVSSLLYSDYTKNNISTRQQTETKDIEALKLMKKQYGSVEVSAPNAYALPYVDYVLDVPSDSSHYYIEDETIPFYQMVLRGVKPFTVQAFNFSADKDTEFLKAVETGANPYYRWIAKDTDVLQNTKYEGLYSAGYKAWMNSAVSDYKAFDELYSSISNSTIDKYEKLADGIFKTTYSNGVCVIVNYTNSVFWYKDQVVAPKNYLVVEGGN